MIRVAFPGLWEQEQSRKAYIVLHLLSALPWAESEETVEFFQVGPVSLGSAVG